MREESIYSIRIFPPPSLLSPTAPFSHSLILEIWYDSWRTYFPVTPVPKFQKRVMYESRYKAVAGPPIYDFSGNLKGLLYYLSHNFYNFLMTPRF